MTFITTPRVGSVAIRNNRSPALLAPVF